MHPMNTENKERYIILTIGDIDFTYISQVPDKIDCKDSYKYY
jgi:hypothetical protein